MIPDELDRRRNVAEPVGQAAPRHGGDEAGDIHQLAPAALHENPAYQEPSDQQQEILPLRCELVGVRQRRMRRIRLHRHDVSPSVDQFTCPIAFLTRPTSSGEAETILFTSVCTRPAS